VPLAASDIPAAPVVGLMALGVVVAVIGHGTRDKRLQAMGIGLLFLATALMVVLGYVAYTGDEVDPRKPNDPRTPDF